MITVYDANGIAKTGEYVARGVDGFIHTGGSGLEAWRIANCVNHTTNPTGSPAIDTLIAMPFISPAHGGTLDRIAFRVTTGGALGSVARVGLYENTDNKNLYPAALLADSGSTVTTSTGAKTYTISQELEPGRVYWLAYVCGTAAPTLRCLAMANCSHLLGQDNNLNNNLNVGLTVAFTFAALPDPFSGSAAMLQATPIPALSYRFSA